MAALLPNYSHATTRDHSTPLTEGPEFVRTRGMSRWHRPRSGDRKPNGHAAYQLWCGSAAGYSRIGGPALTADSIPDDEPLCATCEGRWQAQQAGTRLRFTPLKDLPPTRCPASGSHILWPAGLRGSRFTCLVCGADARVGVYGYGAPRVCAHQTGPNLIDPCPHHGWNRLTMHDGAIVCACTRGDLW